MSCLRIDQQQLLDFVDKMPAFPNSVQRLVQMTTDINVDSKAIVQVIESDPVMTVKILKVINSPFYGLLQKISSVQRAVVHIGVNTIKNIALSVAAIGALPKHNRAGFDSQAFLLHSVGTAIICKLLTERLQVPVAQHSDYFVAGLLHDFGKIILAEFAPEAYQQVLQDCHAQQCALHELEIAALGIDHSDVGRMLAEHWAFDQSLIDAINHHHNQHADTDLSICLFAADQICKQWQLGFAGNGVIQPFPPVVAKRFGMELDGLVYALGDSASVRTEALSFIRL